MYKKFTQDFFEGLWQSYVHHCFNKYGGDVRKPCELMYTGHADELMDEIIEFTHSYVRRYCYGEIRNDEAKILRQAEKLYNAFDCGRKYAFIKY